MDIIFSYEINKQYIMDEKINGIVSIFIKNTKQKITNECQHNFVTSI